MTYLRVLLGLVIVVLTSHSPALGQSLTEQLRQEELGNLVADVQSYGDPVKGSILFSKRGVKCAQCHGLGRDDLVGPDLSQADAERLEEHLVTSLLYPSQEIKEGYASVSLLMTDGTVITGRLLDQDDRELRLREAEGGNRLLVINTEDVEELINNENSLMPNGLLDTLASRQEFLDLSRYVLSLSTTEFSDQRLGTYAIRGEPISASQTGAVLIETYNCQACHALPASLGFTPTVRAPNLHWARQRIRPGYLRAFLADPHATHSTSRMPNVLTTLPNDQQSEIVESLVHYLKSDLPLPGEQTYNQTVGQSPTNSGAENEAGGLAGSISRGELLFHETGCVACHLPQNGTQVTTYDRLAYPLPQLAGKYDHQALTTFLENPHRARPNGYMPNMRLSHWEAIDVANYLLDLSVSDLNENEPDAFRLDPELAEEGMTQFQNLNCSSCHQADNQAATERLIPIETVPFESGCLSGASGDWPKFSLTEQQRAQIELAFSTTNVVSDDHELQHSLALFNCYACHQRDATGGVSESLDVWFQSEDPGMGEQGRIPPTLTGVGSKLNNQWLRDVLVSGRTIRPYMKTRMPQYGRDNVAHLVDLFDRLDQVEPIETPVFEDQRALRDAGLQLVGNAGLNCVACHTYRYETSETMQGVDLTEMAERLDKNWFTRFLPEPQRYHPATVMPSFWPGGNSVRPEVLDGDTALQIEAIWQYLMRGRDARMPRGVIREPLAILAGDEAVMLRRSYPGVGKRGIGVGYVNQVNLVFDAEQLRLATIWKGDFADPSGVWRGQGSGNVRPLGNSVIQFERGPDLDSLHDPWIVDEGRPPNHRFLGYDLDEQRRPVFRYRFDSLSVTDYFTDLPPLDNEQVRLHRTTTFEIDETLESDDGINPSGLRRLRIASHGSSIETIDGGYLVGGSLRIQLLSDHDAEIVTSDSGKSLVVLLDFDAAPADVVVQYQW